MAEAAGKYLNMFTYKDAKFSHDLTFSSGPITSRHLKHWEAPEGIERLAWLFELDLLSFTELKHSL